MPRSRNNKPTLVYADRAGQILDAPRVVAAERSGKRTTPIDADRLIPLPPGSDLCMLPERLPIGFRTTKRQRCTVDDGVAVAASLPPGYVALSLAAYDSLPQAPQLPLFTYAAVCWHREAFHVPAIRVESDVKHDADQFSDRKLQQLVGQLRRKHPANRLITHLAENCALRYGCANAKNLFYGRWECPIPLAPACNAACLGCISAQPDAPISPPQDRLTFVPDIKHVLEFAVPHLESAPRAMISFGQGCEGEPLLQGELMCEIIRAIRRRTDRGTIHLNSNGSRPDIVEKLCDAGLDSIRVSLNSAQPQIYSRYYRPRLYGFDHVAATVGLARRRGLFTSINYLTFPGLTDSQPEIDALTSLIESTDLNMIQWRNLNIDPDIYCETIGLSAREPAIGLDRWIKQLTQRFPTVRHGYVNPPRESWPIEKLGRTKDRRRVRAD